MSNQTMRKPSAARRARTKAGAAKPSSARRQTARVEGFRDGKPLIFGWGGHLTRVQKNRLQQRFAYGFFGVVIAIVVVVFIFGFIQQTFLIPNQSIVTINGNGVTQDTYRRYLAFKSQDLWNRLQSEFRQQAALQTRVKNGDQAAITQNEVLASQISADESNFSQTQLTQTSMDDIVENQLILQGIAQFERSDPTAKVKLEPTSKEITDAYNTFKAAFPPNESFSDFLSKNNVSADDVRAGVTMQVRRTKMQAYLQAQVVSPTRQAHLLRIQVGSASLAAQLRDKLVKGTATWEALAKQDSLDADSKNTGGDAGWITPWTGDAAISDWVFASGQQVNVISPVIKDATGTFDLIKVLAFDPNRAVDDSLLKAAQSNALSHWLSGRRADAANHISKPNSTMMQDTRNLPVLPNLNTTLPTPVSQSNGGQPGLPPQP
jgi:PPIC-type peptidyl-prolyl cis-trans isomerase-like protein